MGCSASSGGSPAPAPEPEPVAEHAPEPAAPVPAPVAQEQLPEEQTLALIKPDAVRAGKADEIIQLIEDRGFTIVVRKEVQASEFYAEHKGKVFFDTLVEFMSSGPIVALVLSKPGAILAWRALMGPTNTAKAQAEAPDSIRAKYGTDGTQNASHGSDSPASAAREIAFHFPELNDNERTLALIKPDAVRAGKVDDIVKLVQDHSFVIVSRKELQLSPEAARLFYAEHYGKSFFDGLVEFMSSGPLVAMVLAKPGAIKAWRALMGPTNTFKAREEAPESAAREITFFFPALGDERTLALIKPDAVAAGKAEEIVQKIEANGFSIVAKKEMQLSREDAESFYAEHNGKSFFEALVEFMSSGPLVAMVLAKPGAIKAWRALMGPTNTFKAQEEAPDSVRALYGTDGTKNASHGSDAPESATREIAFFFPELNF